MVYIYNKLVQMGLWRFEFTNDNFLSKIIRDTQEGKIVSTYSHENYIQKIEGKTHLNFDCSGFVYYYFQKIRKLKALKEIRNFVSKTKKIPLKDIKRIYSKEYMLFFKKSRYSSKYWQILDNPTELQNGDLIVFTSANIKENHCMLVDSIVGIGKNDIRIKVIDCSQFPHSNDTRKNGYKGIGQGDISIFYSKESGWNSYKHNLHIFSGEFTFARSR